MMRYLGIGFMLLFSLITFGQKRVNVKDLLHEGPLIYDPDTEELFTGIATFFTDAGKVVEEFDYVNGEFIGFHRTYHMNGRLKLEVLKTEDDSVDGDWVTFYSNGQLESIMSICNKRTEGMRMEYYENGKVKSSVNYIDSRREGPYREFSNEGTLLKEVMYVNDVEQK